MFESIVLKKFNFLLLFLSSFFFLVLLWNPILWLTFSLHHCHSLPDWWQDSWAMVADCDTKVVSCRSHVCFFGWRHPCVGCCGVGWVWGQWCILEKGVGCGGREFLLQELVVLIDSGKVMWLDLPAIWPWVNNFLNLIFLIHEIGMLMTVTL